MVWEPAQCHKCHACHAECTSMSPSATPATQSEDLCREVPRPRKREPAQCHKCHACHAECTSMSPSATPATQSVYLCAPPPPPPCDCHESQPRPSGAQARNSSSRRLCVRPLPHESQPRLTAPTRAAAVLRLPHESQPRLSGAHACSSSSRRLCVRRLPHESHTKAYEMSVLCDEWWSDECCDDEWCAVLLV